MDTELHARFYRPFGPPDGAAQPADPGPWIPALDECERHLARLGPYAGLWRGLHRRWSVSGLAGFRALMAVAGEPIGVDDAFRHLRVVQRSQVGPEHKEAAVAVLASLWMVDFVFPGEDPLVEPVLR